MSFYSVLAIVGGLTVLYHLLKLAWSCCCGLGEFVLSAVWQVDLTTYGKWAGTVETLSKLDFKDYFDVCVRVARGCECFFLRKE